MIARRLKPTPLPQLEAAAAHAWREGWWAGIMVGISIGAAMAVALLK